MFFFFFCGERTFRKEIPGYEGMVCQCHHCGNMAGHVIKSHPWFTVCFIPLIPFTIKGHKDVSCHICSFNQPLESRPDVMAMANGGPPPQQQQPPPEQRPQYG
ncbi:ribonuclease p complex subunit [Ophiocordyceps sinensis CO18]|uniref:Ribonuclease p complex subunit n=1 Tax=Ophiocordyceps sinensis (strain Co18 / CGMCC 3.14243) TaxID=911162 RepID=T5AKG1_OPHSC|nr:ribonuclease p complex subunit [Ophiocordyceps sinensis CO18]